MSSSSSDSVVYNAPYSDKYTTSNTIDNTIDIPSPCKLIPSSTPSLIYDDATTSATHNKRGLTLADVKANPFLRRLIVHAAKNKVVNNSELNDDNDIK